MLWDARAKKSIRKLFLHQDDVNSLRFVPCGGPLGVGIVSGRKIDD